MRTWGYNQFCKKHSRDPNKYVKPCAKCGEDKGKGNMSNWCSTCSDICKNCDEVLTDDDKAKKDRSRRHYCSNKCHVASKKNN